MRITWHRYVVTAAAVLALGLPAGCDSSADATGDTGSSTGDETGSSTGGETGSSAGGETGSGAGDTGGDNTAGDMDEDAHSATDDMDAASGGGEDDAGPTDETGDETGGDTGGETGGDPDDQTGGGTGDETGGDTGGGPPDLYAYSGGVCPDISGGTLTLNAGGVSRQIKVFLPATPPAAGTASVMFAWHGLGDSAANFGNVINGAQLASTFNTIVVVPSVFDDGSTGGLFPPMWSFPKAVIGGDPEIDLGLFDDVLACLDEQYDIDNNRVYTLGFSMGALWSTYLTMHRGEYMAAAVVWSGGVHDDLLFGYETPGRQLPVAIAHGGATDTYNLGIAVLEFQNMVTDFANGLVADEHFVVMCDHGSGHTITSDVASASLQFLFAHTWDMSGSPIEASGVGSLFPNSCAAWE